MGLMIYKVFCQGANYWDWRETFMGKCKRGLA